MIRSTEEFRAVVKAARRVGTPLVAVRTAGPASAITQVCEAVNGKQDPPPLVVWHFIGGLQGRNDAGKSAVAKVLGENSSGLGPGDALAIVQRFADDATLFFLNPQRVWEQPDVLQGIWNLRDVFKAGGQMLVLVTPPGRIGRISGPALNSKMGGTLCRPTKSAEQSNCGRSWWRCGEVILKDTAELSSGKRQSGRVDLLHLDTINRPGIARASLLL
jgi:hypothetical protein